MLRLPAIALAASMLLAASAAAQPACLPRPVTTPDSTGRLPSLQLGLAPAPTLCAYDMQDAPAGLGCWTVDAAKGALSASTTTGLPGHGRRVRADAAGCIDGFCVASGAAPPEPRLFAVSSSGTHAAMLDDEAVHVFDVRTKMRTVSIKLSDPQASDTTNVSNVPVRLLFVDDTIFVVGSDAGPFIGVWQFKADGRRLGRIVRNTQSGADGETFNVFQGSVSLLGAGHIALTDAGLRSMLVVPIGEGKPRLIRRTTASAPCSKTHMERMAEGDLTLPAACRAVVRRQFEPYFDASLVQLASGDFLVALTGPAQGELALLDARTLAEKRRIKPAKCPR